MVLLAITGCQQTGARATREALPWSGWFEDRAVERGHIEPGDIAQFGCPPGWMGVDDTWVAVHSGKASATYRGTNPQPRDGTITCIAQKAFALPPPHATSGSDPDPIHQPVTPVEVAVGPDRTTIVFSSALPAVAAVYIGQDTPCGPRLIGVRLGDLMNWLSDPQSAGKRDFLGLVSAGC